MASKNELRLAEYVELDEQIKALTKRFNVLKEAIKKEGTHSTANYSAIVEFQTRTGIDTDKVKEILGDTCPMKDTSYQTLRVVRKTLI